MDLAAVCIQSADLLLIAPGVRRYVELMMDGFPNHCREHRTRSVTRLIRVWNGVMTKSVFSPGFQAVGPSLTFCKKDLLKTNI